MNPSFSSLITIRGRLKIRTNIKTRAVALKLTPCYDGAISYTHISIRSRLAHRTPLFIIIVSIKIIILQFKIAATKSNSMKAIVLQLYGAGNMPPIKDTLIFDQIIVDHWCCMSWDYDS